MQLLTKQAFKDANTENTKLQLQDLYLPTANDEDDPMPGKDDDGDESEENGKGM